jgi:hypothetical protein
MNEADFNELEEVQKKHFYKCQECGQMVDMRQLDDVIFTKIMFLGPIFSMAVQNVSTKSSLNRWIQTPLSSSRHAASFSSARTIKRFPLARCAYAIQIVCALASIAETQPQLQPVFLRFSAMISHYSTPEQRRFH